MPSAACRFSAQGARAMSKHESTADTDSITRERAVATLTKLLALGAVRAAQDDHKPDNQQITHKQNKP